VRRSETPSDQNASVDDTIPTPARCGSKGLPKPTLDGWREKRAGSGSSAVFMLCPYLGRANVKPDSASVRG
jgi:hypothetical protein